MADTPSFDEFRVVLRGYDREQVDAFIREASDRIDALEKERAALMARLGEGGAADADAEIDAVTAEINRILHAAREAAEGMRSRASEDAAAWRAEADTETRAQREQAQSAAEEVRGDAWTTASELLEQVKAYSARLTKDAEQEALNIRAESERDASRHMAQARQDAEETVRHARLEADRLTEDARRESHNLVDSARLEAEAAQERARALEERRAELMSELDVAQNAIAKLEADLGARKDALLAAGALDTSTVRVVVDEPDTDEEWFDDDETVRVVTPDIALAEPAPVDAVELADEVRELRERRQQAESAVAKLLDEVKGGGAAVPQEPAAAVPEPPDAPAAEAEPTPAAESPTPPEPAPPVTAPEPDAVDSLFAALREGAPSPAGATQAPQEVATPEPVPTTTVVTVDPFELRDRLLLPVTNRALRIFKKALVELQNQTLEELREGGEEWRPDRAVFEGAFRPDLETLAQEALVAGYAAAAELTGSASTPHPDNVAPSNPTNEVAGSLFADVDEVAQRAAAAGAGHRQATAAVSRVFRTWRTDGAERHLRAASLASYHDGVLWGLEALQVESVKGIADGRMCAECPASVGTAWAPSGTTPKGTGIPPVHLDCSCTIVPA